MAPQWVTRGFSFLAASKCWPAGGRGGIGAAGNWIFHSAYGMYACAWMSMVASYGVHLAGSAALALVDRLAPRRRGRRPLSLSHGRCTTSAARALRLLLRDL
mgnify:CR=1 FL=1